MRSGSVGGRLRQAVTTGVTIAAALPGIAFAQATEDSAVTIGSYLLIACIVLGVIAVGALFLLWRRKEKIRGSHRIIRTVLCVFAVLVIVALIVVLNVATDMFAGPLNLVFGKVPQSALSLIGA